MKTQEGDLMPTERPELFCQGFLLDDPDLCWDNCEYIDTFVPKNIDIESF